MNSALKSCLQPAFLVCLITLGMAAASKEAVIHIVQVYLKKEPLPLRKSFDEMDEAKLAPYRVVVKSKIEDAETRKELGTENYIEWELEDTEAQASSPVKYCHLLVTYYDLPDLVPHVPEECITGSGDTLLSSGGEQLEIGAGGTRIEALGGDEGISRLPVRYLVFLRNARTMWETGFEYPVLYFFKVNGGFTTGRTGTRRVLAENLLGKYSYFSKVEWQFYGMAPGGRVYGSKQEVLGASAKLMSRLVPVLEEDHWPDWQAANRAKRRADTDSPPAGTAAPKS